jgi:hypothetical protein
MQAHGLPGRVRRQGVTDNVYVPFECINVLVTTPPAYCFSTATKTHWTLELDLSLQYDLPGCAALQQNITMTSLILPRSI